MQPSVFETTSGVGIIGIRGAIYRRTKEMAYGKSSDPISVSQLSYGCSIQMLITGCMFSLFSIKTIKFQVLLAYLFIFIIHYYSTYMCSIYITYMIFLAVCIKILICIKILYNFLKLNPNQANSPQKSLQRLKCK